MYFKMSRVGVPLKRAVPRRWCIYCPILTCRYDILKCTHILSVLLSFETFFGRTNHPFIKQGENILSAQNQFPESM